MARGFVPLFLVGIVAIVLALSAGGYAYTRQGENASSTALSPLAPREDARVARALATADCPAPPAVPDFGDLSYEGALIDTHIHIPAPPDGPASLDSAPLPEPSLGNNITISDYDCVFTQEGIIQAFAFFPVFPGFEATHLKIVKGSVEKYPGLFVPFIMPPDSDNEPGGFPTVTAGALEEMLDVYPGLFKGYGEIGLYARGDHGGPTGAPALPPDSERLRAIYPLVRQNNLLVYFHLGEGQQESFERALAENPDINFIFHGDQLVAYDNGGQNLRALDEILSRHQNVTYGIDELYGDVWLLKPDAPKDAFFKHFENYEELLEKDLATWKWFIEKHPNQVIWGTDRGVGNPWAMNPAVGLTLTRYARAFIARLDPTVQEKFAYKNAQVLLR